jgi:hypothetical protein
VDLTADRFGAVLFRAGLLRVGIVRDYSMCMPAR